MICWLAETFSDLCFIFSKDRAIKKPAHFFIKYVNFRIKKFLRTSSKQETFLGMTVHFPSFRLFYSMWHEIFLREVYFVSLPPKARILDVGSNIGLTILFLKYVYPDSRVTGFEVSETTFGWLKKNTKHLNGVEVLNIGISDHSGTEKFYDCGDGAGSNNIIEGFSRKVQGVKETRVEPLSLFLKEKIDFLKIDIEGSEFKVLKEAGANLRQAKHIIIEVHQIWGEKNSKMDDVFRILDENEFRYGVFYTSLTNKKFNEEPSNISNLLISAKRIK